MNVVKKEKKRDINKKVGRVEFYQPFILWLRSVALVMLDSNKICAIQGILIFILQRLIVILDVVVKIML